MSRPSLISALSRASVVSFIAFVLLVAVAVAIISPPLQNLIDDVMMSAISPFTHPRSNVVVVAIGEKTLSAFPYRSPVDRAFLSNVIKEISSANPRVIGIDLLFDQPTEEPKDLLLQSVIQSSGVPIVIASASENDGLSPAQLRYLDAFAPSAPRGLSTLFQDNLDGVVRSTFLGMDTKSGWAAGFASAIANAAGIDVGRQPRRMVYYRTARSTPYRFPVYPAEAIHLAPSGWLRGKIVLLGTVLSQEDRHPTPFTLLRGPEDGDLPGVTIHANALASFLSHDRVVVPGPAIRVLSFVVLGLLCVWICWRKTSILVKPVAVVGMLAVAWAGDIFLFTKFGILAPVVGPTIAVLGASAYVGFIAWRRDQYEYAFVKDAFSKYVSPEIVATVVKKPATLSLGGEQRTITSVFTDLENFTKISAALAPDAFAEVLNEYLDGICSLFVAHGATIDKIVGDGVVGFFGAPVTQDDQTSRAISLALAVERFGRQVQYKMIEQGVSFGITRIGVHHGKAIVGNFGGKRFFNYTAVGSTVNIAARLESANKFTGTHNCISAQVAERTSGFLLRPIGILRLKGIADGIGAYEALCDDKENKELGERYARAYELLSAYPDRARVAFEVLAKTYPNDGLVRFYERRLANGCLGTGIDIVDK